ncbi:dTDP-4-dehydrorhamnose reductase [Streptomyces fuscichromogenes]|uniref:dTDP-4-dehydrorhamnose reductase n=1 Tax=Streptomyces fuscichromogenes TaxID=1324013 RepID=A0A917XKZ2_9ACTN|nr:dTDP-4-dehydrorhamnose reductase [Streptomyces fuscichromogenes]GGN33587.1 NAD(P)-dependent oxidoreductase [Streptomyces fuscichromogenes]
MTRGPWLVTGANGMLARDLRGALDATGTPAVTLARAELDIADPRAVHRAVRAIRPDVVVNCAAWTAVDAAEAAEAEAHRVNALGPRHLARACAAHGARLLQPSTDYVFSGDGPAPYREQDPTGPRTAYGRTKRAGETGVLEALPADGYVVRTAWLYGVHGTNFVSTMIGLARRGGTVDVVDDQRGQPTWTVDLAAQLVRLGRAAERGFAPPGVYHATSAGQTTWFRLAREIFRLLGSDPGRVRPTTSPALSRAAPRPAYSVLGHDRWREAGLRPIRHWREALAQALPALAAAAPPAAPSRR